MMQTLIDFVTSSEFSTWIGAITGVVTACTAITAITPTKTDDKVLNAVLSVLNFLAGNVLKNRNADDPS